MKLDMKNLKGIHPDLVKVVLRAAEITDIPFKVTEGLRSIERQKDMVATGMSTTMNSRHLTGHAIDLVPYVDLNKDGKISNEEMYSWPLYYKLAKVMKQAARDVGVPVEWGGDWKTFKDGPHWQLPFGKYPKVQKFNALVDNMAPMTDETEKQAAAKGVSALASGASVAGAVGAEPAVRAFSMISEQQNELTSGDYVRIGIAVFLIVGAIWLAWKKLA